MKTQASWKKGLLVVPSVERRRECVGEGPRRSPKLEWYCRMLRSFGFEEALGDCQYGGVGNRGVLT